METLEKVKKAVELQKQINIDIDTFGATSEYNATILDSLISTFTDEECNEFIVLMNNL